MMFNYLIHAWKLAMLIHHPEGPQDAWEPRTDKGLTPLIHPPAPNNFPFVMSSALDLGLDLYKRLQLVSKSVERLQHKLSPKSVFGPNEIDSHEKACVALQSHWRGRTARQFVKKMKNRKECLLRLVETEYNYYNKLLLFLKLIRESKAQNTLVNELNMVLKQLQNLSVFLLSSLLTKLENWHGASNIAQLLKHRLSGFDTFISYICRYTFFYSWIKTNSVPKEFEIVWMDLLIAPVQRLPRIILLLQDLARLTPIYLEDCIQLPVIIESLRQLYASIDESFVPEQEQDKICKNIFKCPFNIASSTSQLILHQPLGEQKKYLFIFTDTIVICDRKHYFSYHYYVYQWSLPVYMISALLSKRLSISVEYQQGKMLCRKDFEFETPKALDKAWNALKYVHTLGSSAQAGGLYAPEHRPKIMNTRRPSLPNLIMRKKSLDEETLVFQDCESPMDLWPKMSESCK